MFASAAYCFIMHTLTVLLAEDEPIISMEIRQILEDQGHRVIQANALNDLKDPVFSINHPWPFLTSGKKNGMMACLLPNTLKNGLGSLSCSLQASCRRKSKQLITLMPA